VADWLIALIVVFLLLVLGGYISALRYSLTFARKSELEEYEKSGDPRALPALKLLDVPDSVNLHVHAMLAIITIAAAAIGVVYLCEHISAWLVQKQSLVAQPHCYWAGFLIYILILGFFRILIIDSLAYKIAKRSTSRMALMAAGPIRFLMILARIPIIILNLISKLLLMVFGIKPHPAAEGLTEERIIDMIDEGTKTGEIDTTEQELIKSVFHFSETTASQCMTPRTEISAINTEDGDEKNLRFIREEGYSRYPIFKDDLDHIIGMVFTRDVINILYDKELIILHDLVRPAYFVPDSRKISELLKDFQANQVHMAIVLDEFGGTAGLITIEDIIEELVGEIQDEFDTEEDEFRLLSEELAEVHAGMDVDDFNESFGAELPEDLADTIGGLIISHLGELPNLRQKVTIDGIEFTIASLEGNRIKKVLARKIEAAQNQ
jgi:putative hemolysin